MAIKTVSQLDRFDNGINSASGSSTNKQIGGNLEYYSDGYLTTNDKEWSHAIIGRSTNFHIGQTSKIDDANMDKNTRTYWMSLLEISKPSIAGSDASDQSTVYSSYNTTYEDLLQNILYDVKSYLNYRNRLDDYNLKDIVEGDQNLSGTKYLYGNLSVSNNISTNFLSSNDLTSINLSSTNLSTVNLSVANKCLIKSTYISTCWTPNTTTSSYIDAMSYGIANHDGVGVTVGSNNNSVGNPVCFVNGRPNELTAVNYAINLIGSDGRPLSVGNGYIKSVAGITGTARSTKDQYSAMFIQNGIISATNVIDFAMHAYWSDIGEKYLADREYEPGTLVKFGGEKEITIADDEVNAIVSTKAFDLNACLPNGTVICLCGRVPTKVIGKIDKFDRIMLSKVPGIACKWDGNSRVIGCALESSDDEKIKLVECVTRFTI